MTNATMVGRPPKSKQHLSKELILWTALPIVQKMGADALSFRVLANELKVTPMAVTYHSGSKRQLLADLVNFAFTHTLPELDETHPAARARTIVSAYYDRALPNANLLRAMLADTSLISEDLVTLTNALKACTQQLNDGDRDNVLLHLLVDYTHGFVLSAASTEDNPLTIEDFLRGIDWMLARATDQEATNEEY